MIRKCLKEYDTCREANDFKFLTNLEDRFRIINLIRIYTINEFLTVIYQRRYYGLLHKEMALDLVWLSICLLLYGPKRPRFAGSSWCKGSFF